MLKHSSRLIENIVRSAAIILLASSVIGLNCIAGYILLTVACIEGVVAVVMVAEYARKGKLLPLLLSSESDGMFWQSFIILWAAISYAKGGCITAHIILFVIVLLAGIVNSCRIK